MTRQQDIAEFELYKEDHTETELKELRTKAMDMFWSTMTLNKKIEDYPVNELFEQNDYMRLTIIHRTRNLDTRFDLIEKEMDKLRDRGVIN